MNGRFASSFRRLEKAMPGPLAAAVAALAFFPAASFAFVYSPPATVLSFSGVRGESVPTNAAESAEWLGEVSFDGAGPEPQSCGFFPENDWDESRIVPASSVPQLPDGANADKVLFFLTEGARLRHPTGDLPEAPDKATVSTRMFFAEGYTLPSFSGGDVAFALSLLFDRDSEDGKPAVFRAWGLAEGETTASWHEVAFETGSKEWFDIQVEFDNTGGVPRAICSIDGEPACDLGLACGGSGPVKITSVDFIGTGAVSSLSGSAGSVGTVEIGDVGIPVTWLETRAASALRAAGGDAAAAALATAANGRPVWECYVADLDPEDPADDLVADIEIVDGKPVVSILKGASPDRAYETQGAPTPDGPWGPVSASSRFFRVKAALP